MLAVLAALGCRGDRAAVDASGADAGGRDGPGPRLEGCRTPFFEVTFPPTVGAVDRHQSDRSASCAGATAAGAFYAAAAVPTGADAGWLSLLEAALREEEVRLETPILRRRDGLLDGAPGLWLEADAGSRLRVAAALADGRLYLLYAGYGDLTAEAAQQATSFLESFRRTEREAPAPLPPAAPPATTAQPCQLDEAAAATCERERVPPALCAQAAESEPVTLAFCRYLALILTRADCRRGSCPIGQLCSAGLCCPLGATRCGAGCADPRKCQSCDGAGALTQRCTDASRCESCLPARVPGDEGTCQGCNVPHGDACCAGKCTAIYTDENCGACGIACTGGTHCAGERCQ